MPVNDPIFEGWGGRARWGSRILRYQTSVFTPARQRRRAARNAMAKASRRRNR